MREYKQRRADGTWSTALSLAALVDTAMHRVEPGHPPYVLTQDGEQLNGELTRNDAVLLLKKAISHREVGPTFRIRDARDVQITARAALGVNDADTTSGNQACDILWNEIRATWSGFDPRYAGAYVCKYVAGSSTLSQHSYGNADDTFFDTLAHQDRVADWVVSESGLLHPYHVITQRRIWTKGSGWASYSGDFHGHLHVDFDPQFSGGCGVRGVL